MPLISIITATFNASNTLDVLIESIVKSREHALIEFIIIDGGSKDGTLDIIEKYKESIDYYVSEPDQGIYDAWNKGILKAKGEWIMFLGADDSLRDSCIPHYRNFIKENKNLNLEYISSKVQIVDKDRKALWVSGGAWKWPEFKYRMTTAHPGSLHSKKLFETYGLFDTSYKITGDYELLLRPMNKLKYGFLNEITVEMMEGGVSNSYSAIREYLKSVITTGKANPVLAYLTGFYIYIKSLVNRAGRKVGVNLNRKR